MVRLSDLSEHEAAHLLALECPQFDDAPFAEAPPLKDARVALITSAGLSRRDDETFRAGATDYRVIPGDVASGDLVMSHVSTNYDRSGFAQDLNTVFPVDRLRELAAEGIIGSAAAFHYSFMGATEPEALEESARDLAGLLKEDRVNAVFLTPV
ncbi:MAG TPA: selenoprotein B glycine/betaine/sarcosine/D-proline reductase [Rhodospirillaceae bacterium]|nr:selenoprotein B glycine/betaine/sarcosine/D-proline reductase [Rhodospirillaceae bacterium]HAA93538.1 selenoprotein B glycine/betaine/sarcosine/D-proline reductase [Rhodospirillaceae bacterium]HAT35005.1 selenoprotein B glycine/betaine/sarcosine/D-proline reductase [Rhodospirillaceae bacterium]